MVIRDDLKGTVSYKNAVKKYRQDVKLNYVAVLLMFIIGLPIPLLVEYLVHLNCLPDFLYNIFFTNEVGIYVGPFGLKNLIIFIVIEFVLIIFWHLFKLRDNFKVIEIFIFDKEQQLKKVTDVTFHLYEGDDLYKIEDKYLYYDVENNNSYCFLCRGNKILGIVH